jgi:hypothetical protein
MKRNNHTRAHRPHVSHAPQTHIYHGEPVGIPVGNAHTVTHGLSPKSGHFAHGFTHGLAQNAHGYAHTNYYITILLLLRTINNLLFFYY